MNNKYHDAVEHLEFSDNLFTRVTAAERKPQSRFRLLRAVAIAALITALMATTVFGALSTIREKPTKVETLGTASEDLTDASLMSFSLSDQAGGVTVHYMELYADVSYTFRHGLLYSEKTGFLRITEDYQLEAVEMNTAAYSFEKNDRTYTLEFSYLDTPDGVFSNHKSAYQKNENGEILLNATDGNSGQWPVYLNTETGEVRDALPDWTADDFAGRVTYSDPLKDGILVSTIVETDEMKEIVENGTVVGWKDGSYNLLYWIADGEQEAKLVGLPEDYTWYVDNDVLYCQNSAGHLSFFDDNFDLQSISDYDTNDDLTDGLLTVAVDGKLGILDVLTGDTYLFQDISVRASELDETMGYHAIRYGKDGRIALVQTEWRTAEARVALLKLGVLDLDSGEMRMLDIENEYDGYRNGWLDADRLAVVYKNGEQQYLCVYEFTNP